MQANSGASRVLLLSVFVSFVLAATALGQQVVDKSAPTTSTSTTNAPSPEGSKYVGAETCKNCHEAIYNGWEKSAHWKTTLNKEGRPAKARVRSLPRSRSRTMWKVAATRPRYSSSTDDSRQETSARCLTCHGDRPRAGPFSGVCPRQQRRRLPRLPFALITPRKNNTSRPESATVVLRMPYRG